ncbi:undecaprenyl-phosphate glucose phosphotransferase [Marinobacterium lutimaris]|uniref:Putative colanic acid biosysnthesis UDP-glucose lipid carrier transferase n=1 Tax=Marinobacterium lutimaris TaxID=568106 RepID=A0A1H6B9Y3_9GAMM|nr:undecaprenyl-phosphate glucose phosphotransferase [Marinobacterium lutimaris]SEG57354.1 putative colanic acid biosysnthesis UDP-glucose lipid carrier transferase [Marinobacterium lutimaris]
MSEAPALEVRAYPMHRLAMLSDCFAVLLGSSAAYLLRFGTMPVTDHFVLATVVMMLCIILVNYTTESYSQWRTTSLLRLLVNLLQNWALVSLIIATLIYFTDTSQKYSRLWLGFSLLISFLLAGSARVSAHLLLSHLRTSGRNRRQVYLLGPPATLLKVARKMRKNSNEGFSIGGVTRLSEACTDSFLQKTVEKIRQSGCDEVWISVPLDMGSLVKALMYALRNETIEIRYMPELRDIPLLNHRVSSVAGMYSIDLSVTPMSGPARVFKRGEDLLIGGLIMLLISPLCLAIALAIKLTSPGPVLFKQYRTGINGCRFKVYKFRSMKVHQECDGQVTQATKGDCRITPIGAFLRRTSLDELPQFYNVLQGRMSIVGPRPHALAHNEYYKDIVESYMRRHKVKPGITGWAQVNGYRGETDTLEKMEKRVQYDLWYIDNWSLWLDLKIILATLFKGFINRNAY